MMIQIGCAIPLIKKDMPNPNNSAANASVSSVTSDTTQAETLASALKITQDPGSRSDMAI